MLKRVNTLEIEMHFKFRAALELLKLITSLITDYLPLL